MALHERISTRATGRKETIKQTKQLFRTAGVIIAATGNKMFFTIRQ